MSTSLDRTALELRMSRGPHSRSALHRIELALEAAGAADSQADAQTLLWDAVDVVGERAPLRAVLRHAGVDVVAVDRHLRLIESEHAQQQQAELLNQWRSAVRGAVR